MWCLVKFVKFLFFVFVWLMENWFFSLVFVICFVNVNNGVFNERREYWFLCKLIMLLYINLNLGNLMKILKFIMNS